LLLQLSGYKQNEQANKKDIKEYHDNHPDGPLPSAFKQYSKGLSSQVALNE
jgi:hypothetical protein